MKKWFSWGSKEEPEVQTHPQRLIPDYAPPRQLSEKKDDKKKPEVGEVWKYTGDSKISSKLVSGMRDWIKDENFKIERIEDDGTLVLTGQYDKNERKVDSSFFKSHFRLRTSYDVKAARVQFAGHAMAFLDAEKD